MKASFRSHSTPVARRVGLTLLLVALAMTAVGAGVGAGGGGAAEAGAGAIGLASAQAQNGTGTGANATNGNGTTGPPGAADYQVIRGTFTTTLTDGEVLQNKLILANNKRVHITARGSGWTIRNVAIVNPHNGDESVINVQVNSRKGLGLIHNLYISNTSANAIFANAGHQGRILIQNSTFLHINEDACYCSPPGNLHGVGWGKEPGQGGTVTVRSSYFRDVGNGEPGYGVRLGSDGSAVIDSTFVNVNVAVANLFAVGSGGSMNEGVRPGVSIVNVSVARSGTGLRLGSHQSGFQSRIDRSTVTQLRGVSIDAVQQVERNINPTVRGAVSGTPSVAPPAAAPRSPKRAASGVGGGTGTIGGPVGTGTGFFPLTEIVTVSGFLMVGLLAAIVLGALGVFYLLERKSGAMSLFVVLLVLGALVAGAVGPALAQPAPAPTPNGTNGTNTSADGSDTPIPVQTLAPDDQATTSTPPQAAQTNASNATRRSAVNASTGTNTSNVTSGPNASGSGGSSGGFGFGVPSTGDIAGEVVNATIGKLTGMFTDALGALFMLPWKFVIMRFAPFDGASGGGPEGPLAIWERPDAPLFGQLYDIAMGSMLWIALLLFAVMFLIDWFGNLSKHPGADGPVDRLMLRAADCLHLLFSWPIAWGHFLLASYLAAVFMPSQETIASTVNEGLGNVVGLISAGGAVIVLPFLLAIVLWLLLKHAGAFVYLVIGLAAYPALVGASVPDHWLLGRLGNYAENTRQKYPVAAWWPVPTAVVLGIGYAIDNALLELLTAGDLLNDAAGGAIVYPALWLAALYAPIKVFSDGTPPLLRRRSRSSTGGRPSSGGGSGSPLSRGGTAAVTGGAAGALAAGAGSAAGSGASVASSAGGAVSSAGAGASGEFSRLASGSPSARTLAGDGGTMSVENVQAATGSGAGGAGGGGGGSNAIGGSFGPSAGGASGSAGSGGSSAGHSAFDGGADTGAGNSGSEDFGGASGFSGTTGTDQTGDALNAAEGIAKPSNEAFDTTQRYEPLVHQENAGFQRVDPPKDANWLSEKGGFDRLNQAYDEPVRPRGENDGQLYDLSDAADSGPSFDRTASTGSDTIRDT